jgi:hypothetical protein
MMMGSYLVVVVPYIRFWYMKKLYVLKAISDGCKGKPEILKSLHLVLLYLALGNWKIAKSEAMDELLMAGVDIELKTRPYKEVMARWERVFGPYHEVTLNIIDGAAIYCGKEPSYILTVRLSNERPILSESY